MKTIKLEYPHTLNIDELPETVTAIGFFDGIHKGHQKVINSAVQIAQEKKLESAVINFHQNPTVVLRIGKKQDKNIKHKRNQKVIKYAVQIAQEKKLESAVITFHPHPSVVLSKGKKQVKYITPIQEKQSILQNMSVDRLYIIKFNEELASLSPQEFVDQFIIGLNI